MIQVGKPRADDKKKKYSHANIKTDIEGWANVSEYLPEDFELVLLRNAEGTTYFGWYTGAEWDGLRTKMRKTTHWKRCSYEQF